MLKRKLLPKFWTCIVTIVTATALMLVWNTSERIKDIADRQSFTEVLSNYDQASHQNVKSQASVSVKDRLEDRKMLVEQLCRERSNNGVQPYEITGNNKINVSYCVIPKAGCTVWIRIFKYLAGQKLYTGNPMKISKFEVHYRETRKYTRFDMKRAVDFHFVRRSLRVVTVRDPWTRLWSAYIDKLLLPDFWQTKGKQIISMVRDHASKKSLACGHDVTFPEFIQYVIKVGHNTTFVNQDKHWLPASDLCDPCVYRPDIIAKQETLFGDLTYVLNNRGMNEIRTIIKSPNHTEYEIFDEIKYNIAIFEKHSRCTSLLDLCKRMWTAFKLNGYIPEHETLDKDIKPLNERTFFNLIMKIRTKNNMTKDDTKRLRRKALLQAYSSIPTMDILALKELYKNDFQYFNYESFPNFLNALSRNPSSR